ncbi:hypothetical protein FXO38_07553 [Capsicum annuum]|nr:hypothetical protein FXO38_07553 [Capsicum annuum]
MVKVHKAFKGVVSTASISRKQKAKEIFKILLRKKVEIKESKSENESKIVAKIKEFKEFKESSAQESDDVEGSEGESEGESNRESESDSGGEENKRDSGDGEDDDPLFLPICIRDISVELYDLTIWMD